MFLDFNIQMQSHSNNLLAPPHLNRLHLKYIQHKKSRLKFQAALINS